MLPCTSLISEKEPGHKTFKKNDQRLQVYIMVIEITKTKKNGEKQRLRRQMYLVRP